MNAQQSTLFAILCFLSLMGIAGCLPFVSVKRWWGRVLHRTACRIPAVQSALVVIAIAGTATTLVGLHPFPIAAVCFFAGAFAYVITAAIVHYRACQLPSGTGWN